MTSGKNIEFRKNSFLNKSNSAFIEEMYVKYIEKDPNLPESWKNYFSDLDEDIQSVIKADFQEAGDEDVFRKIKKDLKDHSLSDEDIRKKMKEFDEKAKSDFI